MKAYYTDNRITVYCADNRTVDWPLADLVLTDPPYSATTHSGAMEMVKEGTPDPETGKRKIINVEKLIDFDHLADDEVKPLFARLGVHARRWVLAFCDWRHAAMLDADPPKALRFVRAGVWVKPNGAPQFTGDRPAMGYETIAMLHRQDVKLSWNGGGSPAVYIANKPHHAHRISDHPNAKPIEVIAKLIEQFSDKNDLVFDPFAGSGVVGATAVLLGRRATVIEQNEEHCANLVYYLKHHTPRRSGVSVDGGLFDEIEEATP